MMLSDGAKFEGADAGLPRLSLARAQEAEAYRNSAACGPSFVCEMPTPCQC
jgi:hypothetical protein